MDEKTKRNSRRAHTAIEAASASAKTSEGRNRVEEVQLHFDGVVEPGYKDHAIVATGNWNDISKTKHHDSDGIMPRLGAVLEKLGVELEWSDEWDTCNECSKLFRTSPDSYGWQRSFAEVDGSILCVECLADDPAEYLRSLEGETKRCNSIKAINPAKHGYVLVEDSFENGFHPGQDADPKVIGKALGAQGIERFLFNLDSTGQFDVRFSVYVHEEEADKLDREKFDEAEKDGPSVSEALKRGLQEASAKMAELPDGQGVKYAKLSADGTASVRVVSPEEFIEGIKD